VAKLQYLEPIKKLLKHTISKNFIGLIGYNFKVKKQIKRIAYDIAGVSLIIASPLLGWLPGPGGIPLFLAGLGLLAVHNEWARNLLHIAKIHAEDFLDFIFPLENNRLKIIHDIIGTILLITSLVLLATLSKPFVYIVPFMFLASGLFWVLYNRRRYKVFLPKKHK
jgi:hypothetical protein